MKMKSEWRVTANPVGGKILYGVYRLRDINAVDHSGNREHHGEYTEDKEKAKKIAEDLNQKGE